MSNEMVGILGLILLLALMFLRMKVGTAMMFISLVGLWYMNGFKIAISTVGGIAFSEMTNYTLTCLPLFILMGSILSVSGIGGKLYIFARAYLGRLKGGLAMATVVACGFFAAICGNSVATAVTMSKLALPEMRKYGYQEGFAVATIVAGGTIGIMIPPSVTMILYGWITEVSIGRLFMAGFIPGIMQVVFYVVVIFIMNKIKPSYSGETVAVPRRERLRTIAPIWPVVVIFLFVIGSIYGGICTPTEAGGVGAVAAFIVALLTRSINLKKLDFAVKDTIRSAAMTFFLILGAYYFIRFMAVSGMSSMIANAILNWQADAGIPPIGVIIMLIVFFFITGCFLDSLSVMLLMLPIIYPIVIGMGYDGVWWGIIMTRMMEISMVTPPYGLNLFVMGRESGIKLTIIYKGVVPFIISDIVQVVILVAFPGISTWLPNTLM